MSLVSPAVAIMAALEAAVLIGVPVPASVQMLILASLTLYVGCYASLLSKSKPEETMKKSDALQMPIVAGVMLVGLYMCFKYLDPSMVNIVLRLYFVVLGCASVAEHAISFVSRFIDNHTVVFTIPAIPKVSEGVTITPAFIMSLVVGGVVSAGYFFTNHWLLHNILGISFCVRALSLIRIGTASTGSIMLAGLFFYDIFMVFYSGKLTGGESIMVSVATKVQGPITLLFPLPPDEIVEGKRPYSLLGLGDIIVPGIYLAHLLFFDRALHSERVNKKYSELKTNFPAVQFNVTFIAYVLGLVLTVVVMYAYKHAQPALLYLVPAVLMSSFPVAIIRGLFSKMLEYDSEKDLQLLEDEGKKTE